MQQQCLPGSRWRQQSTGQSRPWTTTLGQLTACPGACPVWSPCLSPGDLQRRKKTVWACRVQTCGPLLSPDNTKLHTKAPPRDREESEEMGRLTVHLVRVCPQNTWPMGFHLILGPALLGHSKSDQPLFSILALPGNSVVSVVPRFTCGSFVVGQHTCRPGGREGPGRHPR